MPAIRSPDGTLEKRCRQCGKRKPVIEFDDYPVSPEGLDRWCKACRNPTRATRSRRVPFPGHLEPRVESRPAAVSGSSAEHTKERSQIYSPEISALGLPMPQSTGVGTAFEKLDHAIRLILEALGDSTAMQAEGARNLFSKRVDCRVEVRVVAR